MLNNGLTRRKTTYKKVNKLPFSDFVCSMTQRNLIVCSVALDCEGGQ